MHITFQNAEPLIEKFNQDLFERYELIREFKSSSTHQQVQETTSSHRDHQQFANNLNHKARRYGQQQVEGDQSANLLSIKKIEKGFRENVSKSESLIQQQQSSGYSYFYYDTSNNNLIDLNTMQQVETTKNMGHRSASANVHVAATSKDGGFRLNTLPGTGSMDQLADSQSQTRIVYPLTFIDAVNRKQLDLESGLFKDPADGQFKLKLVDALKFNFLDARSAYICDSSARRTYDLSEAIDAKILSASTSRVHVPAVPNGGTLSLADALKTGLLKIGEPIKFMKFANAQTGGQAQTKQRSNSATHTSNSCSVTSETQSMSVRSIKDPKTGEFLAPTEAIKRRLLDPYKGIFINPLTNEQMTISEGIQKGHVLVEMICQSAADNPSSHQHQQVSATATASTGPSSNSVISTSLIRETKSYHLLGVYDPLKNDEISIKEAIARGILDRQRGLYVHGKSQLST